jgi:hypothetical protein
VNVLLHQSSNSATTIIMGITITKQADQTLELYTIPGGIQRGHLLQLPHHHPHHHHQQLNKHQNLLQSVPHLKPEDLVRRD